MKLRNLKPFFEKISNRFPQKFHSFSFKKKTVSVSGRKMISNLISPLGGLWGGEKRRKVETFLCHYFTSGKRRLCHRLVTVPRPHRPMNEMNEPEEGEVAAAVASFNSLKKKKKKNLVHRTHTQKNRIKFYVPGHLEQRKYSRVSVR